MHFATIDLGTNFFQLLIVEVSTATYTPIFQTQYSVFLAADGFGHIGDTAMRAAKAALTQIKNHLLAYSVSETRAVGTAALRSADNAQELVEWAARELGIPIRVVDGMEEAAYIAKGVQSVLPKDWQKPFLVMDIGGGSVEFILADAHTIYWKQSFPIGLAIIAPRFLDTTVAATPQDIIKIQAYLREALAPLQAALDRYPVKDIVGAAGVFKSFAVILETPMVDRCVPLSVSLFRAFGKTIQFSSLAERVSNPQIPENRREYIVPAYLLIDFVLHFVDTENLFVANAALKEGVMIDLLPLHSK